MKTVDETRSSAPPEVCFRAARDVERWPAILPHYRRVRFLERRGPGQGTVEMAAWRDFAGPLRYPAWWVSEMASDAAAPVIRYRHTRGITRGMAVVWEFHRDGDGTLIRIVHEWEGPAWPLVGTWVARRVIGPHFVSAIARRTLVGVRAEAERAAEAPRAPEANRD